MTVQFRLLQLPLVLLVTGLLGGVVTGPVATAQTPLLGETEPCTDGVAANRYSCENVNLKSHFSINSLGGGEEVALNDIWGWTDPETGAEYALVGRTDGTAFVDVSDPTTPIYLGALPSHSGASTWRDVKVYENHAFIVSEAPDHGLQVFDLTQLRSVDDPPVTFSETAHYDGFEMAHNVVINEETGYAYGVGLTGRQNVPSSADCGPGLHVVDVRTPGQPEFAGCHTDPRTGGVTASGYTHDAQCVDYQGPDTDYQGQEICFNANEAEINIADVSDKRGTETITNVTYPNPRYVHQAWLTEGQRYLLVDDELDEVRGVTGRTRTLVFDVSDLDTPELVTTHLGETASSDHNQYVNGKYTFQANYKSGLRILDVSDPEELNEVAHFDTFPASNSAGFEGAWSTYPFFESGVVVVSSIGEGLFVLQPQLAPIFFFAATREGGTATIRWRLTATADTRESVVEQRPPGSTDWTVVETVEGASTGSRQSFEVSATNLRPGTHQFRVRHVEADGSETVSRSARVRVPFEDEIELEGLPNPVQERQQFTLKVGDVQIVDVALYDVLGRRVATLHDGDIDPVSRQSLTMNPQASGVYFLRVQGESIQRTRKVVFTR